MFLNLVSVVGSDFQVGWGKKLRNTIQLEWEVTVNTVLRYRVHCDGP